jgi:hypothetical protein
VGGAKMQMGKAGVQTLVKGDLRENIAGACVVNAKGSLGESAKGKMTIQIGGVLTATAPSIEITGKSEIAIACGGATITIKSGAVEIKAPMVTCTGPTITNDGALVKHNP